MDGFCFDEATFRQFISRRRPPLPQRSWKRFAFSRADGDTPRPLPDANENGVTPSAETVPQQGGPAAPPSAEPAPAVAAAEQAVAAAKDDAPPAKRKRKRRRGGRGRNKNAEGATETTSGAASPASPAPAAAAAAPLSGSLAALAGGLLSHIDEREVSCCAEGCSNTWMWAAEEQIRAYGQRPPKRMCAECSAVSDRPIACSMDGCKRTWVWSHDAQFKHRAWLKRQRDDRRKRKHDGPPRRKCDLCQRKLSKLVERETVCKVHGCTRQVKIERDAQLRAWAALGSDDLDAEGPLPKKMCEVCREFCRTHPDRPVECGRPGCDRGWAFKTGAQLQAFLAGRLEDPIRLACEGSDCDLIKAEAAELAKSGGAPGLAPNTELMPCVVLACEGAWQFRPGMSISACNDGDSPVDRMCEAHRAERGMPSPKAEAEAAPKAEVATPEAEVAMPEPEVAEPEAEAAKPEPEAADKPESSEQAANTSTEPTS